VACFAWHHLAGGTVRRRHPAALALMAAGLEGAAVVATAPRLDRHRAHQSSRPFGSRRGDRAGVRSRCLIGCVAFPGAFLARRWSTDLPVHLHTALLDAIVAVGGAVMIIKASYAEYDEAAPLRPLRRQSLLQSDPGRRSAPSLLSVLRCARAAQPMAGLGREQGRTRLTRRSRRADVALPFVHHVTF